MAGRAPGWREGGWEGEGHDKVLRNCLLTDAEKLDLERSIFSSFFLQRTKIVFFLKKKKKSIFQNHEIALEGSHLASTTQLREMAFYELGASNGLERGRSKGPFPAGQAQPVSGCQAPDGGGEGEM